MLVKILSGLPGSGKSHRIMEMYRRMLEPLPAYWPVLNYTSKH